MGMEFETNRKRQYQALFEFLCAGYQASAVSVLQTLAKPCRCLGSTVSVLQRLLKAGRGSASTVKVYLGCLAGQILVQKLSYKVWPPTTDREKYIEITWTYYLVHCILCIISHTQANRRLIVMSPFSYMLQALLAGTVHFSLSPLSLSKLATYFDRCWNSPTWHCTCKH